MTGWQVAQVAELELCDFWHLNRSQIYRELARLADQGLIEAGEKGVRDQVPYSITDAGRAAFAEWLHEDPTADIVRSSFHLKVTFAEHLDDDVLSRFVRVHRRRTGERLDYYRQLDRKLDGRRPNAAHVLRSGIAYREQVLRWLDSLPWGRG